jgi:DNA (cytosine-5)-methyltransferase 1
MRILEVLPGNVRNNHLYVTKLLDFFPADCVGPAKKNQATACGISIDLDGLDETIQTDIGSDARTGKPRQHFRGRSWVRRFFEHHRIGAGDRLALKRLGERHYRLSLAQSTARKRGRTAAEFFSGIGLVRLALERQGWDVVYANDIDADKAEMYRHNWPGDDHLAVGDIHKVDADQLPTCELFTASFPCNDLSIAGKWEGLSGKESSAFWGLIRLLQELGERRPSIVLLENVVGFLMSNGGGDFEQALTALNELGYSVDAFILNAMHWTPQSRARLFVVARHGRDGPRNTTAIETDSRPQALCEFINFHQHLYWDLRSLPPLPPPAKRLADIVEDLPNDDPHWWSDDRAAYFMAQLSEKHAMIAEQMIAGKSTTYATAFRRVRNGKSMAELRTDGIAGCLRTPRGGSGRQILFAAGRGKYRVRLLTARECARLQGVPDDYVIDVPLNQALFGFGDAVCVPAVEWIAANYLTQLV